MPDQSAVLAEEDFTTAFLRDPTATIVGMTAEHIQLDGVDDELPEGVGRGRIREQVTLENRVRGVTTELTFLDDGFLGASIKRRRRANREHTIDLRYVDPRPFLSKVSSARLKRYAFWSAIAGCAGGALAYLAGSWTIALIAATVWIATAALAATFVYRKYERVTFCTRHGRVPVLTLYGSLGCVRDCRAMVPKVVAAIREASGQLNPKSDRCLRGEIREHYRLRDNGVLGEQDCATATRRVLSHFGAAR